MMHVLACEHVRDQLQAFHDGELPLDDQVLIQGHLRDCVTCAIEAGDLEDLGERLRAMTTSWPDRLLGAPPELPAAVLDRLKVERQLSFRTRMREVFEDMHFVWAACGATAATIVCLLAAMSVLQAANRERPDSLAGLITYLANPGSNANPVRADGWMLLPRPLGNAPMPLVDEDAVFAVSAVVTREGRVQHLELLAAEQALTLRVKPEVVLAMMHAASQARFAPAQAGGAPVAVSLVWLLASTTVKGRPDFERYLASPIWTAPVGLGQAPAATPGDTKTPDRALPSGGETLA